MDPKQLLQQINFRRLTPIQVIGLCIGGLLVLGLVLKFATPTQETVNPEQFNVKIPEVKPTLTDNRQKLTITWNNSEPSVPKELHYYTVTTPLLDQDQVGQMAGILGFTSSQAINTNSNKDLVWVDGNRSLSVNLTTGPFSYSNPNATSSGHFVSDSDTIANAQSLLTNIFGNNNLKFTPDKTVTYYKVSTTGNTVTTIDKANIATVNFNETLKDFIYLTPSGDKGMVTMVITPNRQITFLQIFGGFQQVVESKPVPTLAYSQMTKIAENQAQRLTSGSTTNDESDILSQSSLSFSVNSVDIIYVGGVDNQTISPVYRLTGTLSGPTLTSRNASFAVPALDPATYSN